MVDGPTQISVVMPALNEGATVASVVSEFARHPIVNDIVVVDNCSVDDTAEAARRAGARVIAESRRGYGRAVKTGIMAATNDWIFKCDADLRNPHLHWIDRLLGAACEETALVKGAWDSPEDTLPVTNYATKPALRLLFPNLLRFQMPLTGQFLIRRTAFDIPRLADDYFFDVDVLIRGDAMGLQMEEVCIGELLHTCRSLEHNSNMCFQIVRGIVASNQLATERVAVVMAHPDDAVIWAGGLIVKYLAGGSQVLVISTCGSDDTAKEMSSLDALFPTVRTLCLRRQEFQPVNADLVAAISSLLGEFNPSIIVTHHSADQHADHRTVNATVRAALMYLGRARFPNRILMCSPYFAQTANDGSFRPDILLDISAEVEMKHRLIDMHSTQEPAFWSGMARGIETLYGMQAGVTAAEPFETDRFYTSPRAQARI